VKQDKAKMAGLTPRKQRNNPSGILQKAARAYDAAAKDEGDAA